MLPFRDMALLLFDIDGTLTDGTMWWGGDQAGWIHRFDVRDAEAVGRLKERIFVVPLSRYASADTRRYMEELGLDTRWLGATDPLAALREICTTFEVTPERVCYVGDGFDEAEIFDHVGLGCAVADAHLVARDAAHVVLAHEGGGRVIEEIENRMHGRH